MKRFFRANLAICVIALIAGIISAAIGINAGELPKKVRIIYTNDTAGNLAPCG